MKWLNNRKLSHYPLHSGGLWSAHRGILHFGSETNNPHLTTREVSRDHVRSPSLYLSPTVSPNNLQPEREYRKPTVPTPTTRSATKTVLRRTYVIKQKIPRALKTADTDFFGNSIRFCDRKKGKTFHSAIVNITAILRSINEHEVQNMSALIQVFSTFANKINTAVGKITRTEQHPTKQRKPNTDCDDILSAVYDFSN